MHRRVLQVTALLTTFVVEICTTVRPVATAVLTIMTGNVRVGAALTGQHAFHRLPEIAASGMARFGRLRHWRRLTYCIALRLCKTLLDKLGVVVQMRRNLAP